MAENISEQQQEVNRLLHRALFNAVVWVAGIGSYRAIGYAKQALRMIRSSKEPLAGQTRAKLAYALGIFGISIWFPFIVIGIVISLVNR